MSWWTLLWQQLPKYLASPWRYLLHDLQPYYCCLCGVHVSSALQIESSTGVLMIAVRLDELSKSLLYGHSAEVCRP